jgi:RNA polymerase sigma factor FliA
MAVCVQNVWAEYGRTRSEKLRNVLMEQYLHLVRHIAQRIHSKLPREVELDDLVSAGTFGLMYAIAAFDPGRAVKFETYCGSRIRGAILDELRSWDWVPRLARLRAHKLSNARQQLEAELGRQPSIDELAMRLNVSSRELKRITRDGAVVRVLPLARPAQPHSADEGREGDILEDRAATARFQWLDRDDVRDLIASELSRAEQLILLLYYHEEMTMKEIGATLDLSESRVSQMHSSILTRLRARLNPGERLAVAA